MQKKALKFHSEETLHYQPLLVKHTRLNGDCPCHWHNYFEIEIVQEGTAEVRINGKSYTAQKGDIFFLTPTDFHEWIAPENITLLNLSFTCHLADNETHTLMGQHILRSAMRPDDASFDKVVRMVTEIEMEMKKKQSCYEEALQAWLRLIVVAFVRISGTKERETSGIRSPEIRTAVTYIANSMKMPVTLTEVASKVYLSPNYFSTLFHREMGVTFRKYLSDVRLEMAMRSVSLTDMSIAQVCNTCGLTDVSAFIRAFKRRYGCAPGQFRAQRKKNEAARKVVNAVDRHKIILENNGEK